MNNKYTTTHSYAAACAFGHSIDMAEAAQKLEYWAAFAQSPMYGETMRAQAETMRVIARRVGRRWLEIQNSEW